MRYKSMTTDKQPLRIGLIGFGCVGQGFYDIIQQQPGLGLTIARIAVKSPAKPRSLPADCFTYHADDLLHDPTLNLLVEVIDDPAEAFRLVSAALLQGRRVEHEVCAHERACDAVVVPHVSEEEP